MKKLPESAAIRNPLDQFDLPTGITSLTLVTQPAVIPAVNCRELAVCFRCSVPAVKNLTKQWGIPKITAGKTDVYLWEDIKAAIRKHGAPVPAEQKTKKMPPARAATDDDTAIANGLRLIGGGK